MTKKQKFFAHEKKQAQQKNFAISFAQLTWSLRIPLNLKLKKSKSRTENFVQKIAFLQEMSNKFNYTILKMNKPLMNNTHHRNNSRKKNLS